MVGNDGRVHALAREPAFVALAVLLVGSVLLRGLLMLEWRPALVGYQDSNPYVTNSRGGDFWFSDPLRPVGYPLFLAGARALVDDLSFTTLVQHALGVAAGVAAYVAGRALGLRPAFALVPAAVLLLHGSTIFFAHTILAEALFIPAVWGGLLGLALAHRARTGRGRVLLSAAAGLFLAYAGATRTIGLLLLPLAVLWIVWAFPGEPRGRVVAAASLVLTAGVLLAANLVWAHAQTGSWSFARSGYFQFYGRVASFADCSRFTPPAGTDPLCPQMPPRERHGASWFLFDPASPAVTAWGGPYADNPPWVADRMKAFSRAAVRHQPLDYLRTVGRDVVRLVDPDFPLNPNPAVGNAGAGLGPEGYAIVLLEIDQGGRDWAAANLAVISEVYDTEGRSRGSIGVARFWERHTRLVGLPLVAMALLAIAGTAFRETRRPAVLFAAFAFLLLLTPPVVALYNWRYQIVGLAPLAAAAAFGAQALAARIHLRRRPPPASGQGADAVPG
jgi:hypothetical protein